MSVLDRMANHIMEQKAETQNEYHIGASGFVGGLFSIQS